MGGPAVLSPGVEGLHRLPPAQPHPHPKLVWTPVRAEHPQHLLPIISHSSWQALLEETSSGGEEVILFTGFQSRAMARVSQKEEGRGRGGDIRGQRDGEASRSVFLLPFPCSPRHPQDSGWDWVDLS